MYRWNRIPRDAEGRIADNFPEPPDIAIEIVSPGQSVNRLIRRRISFVRAGVRLASLVDPSDESVAVINARGEELILTAGETLDSSSIIPGL